MVYKIKELLDFTFPNLESKSKDKLWETCIFGFYIKHKLILFKLEGILVINESLDVIQESLLVLPLEREIKFTICLYPNAQLF